MDPRNDTHETDSETDDDSTECRDVTPELEVIDPPDGGWGWVVTAASFMVQFLLDGVPCSFGLMLPELVLAFNSSVSLTSIAPATYVAVFLVTAPAAAYLVRRFGCRLVGFLGGLIASLGITCSAYAPSVELFILFFGGVAGLGVGLIYLPTITMSNLYFDKKRGIVAGIITSGSGFGLLALAQLTEVLIGEYGWRGCHLIMGGVVLNFCVCACLMRPLPFKKPTSALHKDPLQDTETLNEADQQTNHGDVEDSDVVFASQTIVPEILQTVKEDGLSFVSVEEIDAADLHDRERNGSVVHVWSSIKDIFFGQNSMGDSHNHIGNRGGYRYRHEANDPLVAGPIFSRKRAQSSFPLSVFSTWLEMQVPPTLSHHSVDRSSTWRAVPQEKKSQPRVLYSMSKMGYAGATHFHSHTGIAASHLVRSLSTCQSPIPYKTLFRRTNSSRSAPSGLFHKIFDKPPHCTERQISLDDSGHIPSPVHVLFHSQPDLGASMAPTQTQSDGLSLLPEIGEYSNIVPNSQPRDMASIPLTPDTASLRKDSGCDSGLNLEHSSVEKDAHNVDELLYDSVSCSTTTTSEYSSSVGAHNVIRRWFLRQRLLLLFLVGAFLIQLTCNVPILLAPSYAYLHDVTKEQSAQMLSIFGLMNTVGRLGSGLLVYWGCGSLRVHNLGTLLAGVTCFVFPFCTNFATIASCFAFLGLFLGAFPPLQPVILVEYLGIKRLASVFGTMCAVKAFANLAGAPLAGAVYGVTGVYTIPVAGCGAILVLAALLHEFAACCTPSRDQPAQKNNDSTTS